MKPLSTLAVIVTLVSAPAAADPEYSPYVDRQVEPRDRYVGEYSTDIYMGEIRGRQRYTSEGEPLLPYRNSFGETELPGATDTNEGYVGDVFKRRRQ